MTLLEWINEGNLYVKTRVTFTVGPAHSPQNYYLPAQAWPGTASFRPAPGPQNIIDSVLPRIEKGHGAA